MNATMRRAGLVVMAAAFALPPDADAHHAFAADYEAGREGTISGVVTEVIYKNPHARYYLEVEAEGGSTELWDLETMNLMMLGRMGWKKDTIRVGDELTVNGILGRNDTKRMSIVTVELPGGRVISPVRSLRTTNAELNAGGDGEEGAIQSLARAISPGRYELDKTHAYIAFSYSHMGLSNPQLHFTDFDAELDLDGRNMSGSMVSLRIDPASVASGVTELDEELRGPEFFDVANHPEISFVSTGYEELTASTGTLSGELTVLGVSQPVTLDVAINDAKMNRMVRKEMIGFSANGVIQRSDFGLDAYAQFVSDDLALDIQVEFVRAD